MVKMVAEGVAPEKRGWFGLSPVALALLVAIVALGAIVRFWNLNWDQGTYDLHPDERTLNEMVRRLGPDLNPHFYYYGTLPIYLYKATAKVLSAVTGEDWQARERLLLVGRFFSSLASVVTLLMVFAIGRRIWGVSVGLLSAALMASAGLAIQAAHFSTVDSLLTLELVVTLWASLRILDGGGRRWYIFAGVVQGLALATKLTSASFVVMPLLAHLLQLRWARITDDIRSPEVAEPSTQVATAPKKHIQNRKWDLIFFFGSAAVATLVVEPYYVLGWDEFWKAIQVTSDELSGAPRFSYVWQFIGTTPYLFELRNLVVWGLGVPFGVAALVGWGSAIADCGSVLRPSRIADWVRSRARGVSAPLALNNNVPADIQAPTDPQSAKDEGRSRNPQSIIVLVVWPTLYFLYVGTWQARFIRHLMPLVPFCCLFVGGLVARLTSEREWQVTRRLPVWVGRAVGGVVLVGAAAWGLSVTAVYTTLDTRLEATAWFRDNVPPGTRIVIEDNHRPLIPIPDAAHPVETYMYNTLKVTDTDTPQKMTDFAGALATGELLVVPDRRWSAVLPRIPGFRLTGNYYHLLFDGKLGYTPVVTFSDPPRLGLFTWSDDDAEETFQVFDHPTVKVFRNTGKLSEAELRGLLGAEP